MAKKRQQRKPRSNDKVKIQLLQEKTILRKDLNKYRKLGYTSNIPGKRYKSIYVPRKQEKKVKRIKTSTAPKVIQEEDKIYRYSIAYSFYGNGYGKTFRAEVYTKDKVSENKIHTQLEYFMRAKLSHLNKGLQVMFNRATYEGLESEQVGKNDLGNSQLNRMFFYMD